MFRHQPRVARRASRSAPWPVAASLRLLALAACGEKEDGDAARPPGRRRRASRPTRRWPRRCRTRSSPTARSWSAPTRRTRRTSSSTPTARPSSASTSTCSTRSPQKLGLTAEFQPAKFDAIIPGVGSGKYEVGVSSFTDQRRAQEAGQHGQLLLRPAPSGRPRRATRPIDPDNACGKKVAVQTGTVQVDDITARSKKCTDAGKPAITIDQYQAPGRGHQRGRVAARTTRCWPTRRSARTR